MANIVCFGEALWDVFLDSKKIGGAPLNVAFRANCFDNFVTLISAVGDDELGHALLDFLLEHDLHTDNIQINSYYKTGDVQVTLNKEGTASYVIEYPRAWDKIQLTEHSKRAVANSDAFIFGSLITRDNVSKNTLYSLLEFASYRVFDLNLRPPYFSNDILIYLLNKADFIKLNEEELNMVSTYLKFESKSLEQRIHYISEQTKTNHICVTRGENGAVLFYDNQMYYNKGYQVKVGDTVGAGDAFLGFLLNELLNEAPPQQAIDYACAIGAMVAQNKGATPKFSVSDISGFIETMVKSE